MTAGRAEIREGGFTMVDATEEMTAHHTDSAFDLLQQIFLGWWKTIGSTRRSGIPQLIVSEAQNFPEMCQFY